jgi:hypothetical protein
MLSDDMRSATARRDEGIRRITRLTWQAGVLGLVCSAVIAVALGHHADAGTASHTQQGSILVPSQPPAPVPGVGQVTSGAS